MIIPTEVRLKIYGFVFGINTVILEAQYIASEDRNYSYLLHKQRSITNPINMRQDPQGSSSDPLRKYDIHCKHAC
jgi:hypothetical protein